MRDAAESLGQAYLDIRREGCIQFDDMMVVVHCNVQETVAIEIKFQSIGASLIGLKKENTALKHCNILLDYLKSCIRQWRESLNEMQR